MFELKTQGPYIAKIIEKIDLILSTQSTECTWQVFYTYREICIMMMRYCKVQINETDIQGVIYANICIIYSNIPVSSNQRVIELSITSNIYLERLTPRLVSCSPIRPVRYLAHTYTHTSTHTHIVGILYSDIWATSWVERLSVGDDIQITIWVSLIKCGFVR